MSKILIEALKSAQLLLVELRGTSSVDLDIRDDRKNAKLWDFKCNSIIKDCLEEELAIDRAIEEHENSQKLEPSGAW